ncbi:MAG: DnaJ domain-containing protein [Chitinophagales bacterium]
MKNYYAILNLYFGASSSDIKKAYYQLARKYHPDKNNGNAYFEDKFKEINEAYYILSDENRRIIYHAAYDEFLHPKTEPETLVIQKPFQPGQIRPQPMQPRGPASDYSVDFLGVRIAIFVAILAMCIFLFVKSIQFSRENRLNNEILSEYTDSVNNIIPNSDDNFYRALTIEAAESGDSTLLKSNLDSLKHVYDSIMDGYYSVKE